MDDDEECPPICTPGPWPNKLETSPPSFGDIGSHAQKIFEKGYHFGLIKLNFKTTTQGGVEFSSGGVNDKESGDVVANVESKYKFKDYGVTFIERWNSENVLSGEISLSDFCEGIKIGVESSFRMESAEKACKLKLDYMNGWTAMNLAVDFKQGGPNIAGAAVLGYKGYLLGYATQYESESSEFTTKRLSFGLVGTNYVISSDYNEALSGALYYKYSEALQIGAQYTAASEESDSEFGFGCKYAICDEATLGIKVNNKSMIGVSFQQNISKCVTLYLSTEIDSKNLNAGGHKVGLALELDA